MQEFVKLRPTDPSIKQFLSEKKTSFFSTPIWSEILQKGFQVKAWYYCLREGEEIFLALPGVLFNFKILKLFYANMPYGEFIGDVKYLPSFLDLIEYQLKAENVHLLRIAQLGDQDLFLLKGYHPRKGYQHILDLNGMNPEILWNQYKSSIRRNIKKAEKLQVSVREIKQNSELDSLYWLYLETMKRNHATPIWTKRIFEAIYDLLVTQGQASILFAEWKDHIIAGMILIFSDETTSYFLGASETSTHSLRANDLLFHKAILKSILEKKRSFDFMTCVEWDEDLIRFKEKWGAKRLPFVIYEKELNPFRSKIWTFIWRIINSKLGSYLLNKFLLSFEKMFNISGRY